ncbi:phosphopentomutase [Desulfovibrio sp. OttesenSCG-928-G15]|nr:phosphopentomutase [Desulfovibrio sp. OttesenSCG-928-G15]
MANTPGRFIIIVLDGFGVGTMPDVGEVRPADTGANTCRSIFAHRPDLYLPSLEKLGLVNVAGHAGSLGKAMREAPDALCGKAMLMHFGADTFFGHQEIMGTLPRKPFAEPFRNTLSAAENALRTQGFSIRRHKAGGNELLVVDEAATVADNLEADPGQAINVTAALDDMDFDRVREIGRLVRGQSKVPRIIAFGGRGVHLENLLAAVEVRGELAGVNAPASGVYANDYHCVHMGYGVNPDVQVQSILGKAGVPVFLLGKAADVIANPYGASFPMVDTEAVLDKTQELVRQNPTGFFCANVQETDLCGHREDIDCYAGKLLAADRGIAALLDALSPQDILVVMADHGNDPTIGHPHHTRELVPLLVRAAHKGPLDIGIRTTLSDVGTSAADYFHTSPPENGTSFLPLLTANTVQA